MTSARIPFLAGVGSGPVERPVLARHRSNVPTEQFAAGARVEPVESIAGGVSYSTALEAILPQILDVGGKHDELHGWRLSRVTIRHEQLGIYVATWEALTGHPRQVGARGGNVGEALRALLAELYRRIARAEEEA